jgi:CubicO group peptidase (beta-lactamase class C family)
MSLSSDVMEGLAPPLTVHPHAAAAPAMTDLERTRPAPTLDLGAARELASRYVRERVLPSVVFGVADGAGGQAIVAVGDPRYRVGADAVYFLASVTKAIVATAVMRYVDEGRWDLHAPLARYLPDFVGSGREAVTAWHVLTHTSGLPDVPVEELRRLRPSYAHLSREVRRHVPRWAPGSRYEYSSSAWLLLSDTMAALSGMPFARALEQRLTGPLGMVDTSFDPRPARGRIVSVNGSGPRDRLVDEILVRFLARATLPGGGMFGTVDDLLRLGTALLPGAPTGSDGPVLRRVLTRAAVEAMSALQTDGIPHLAEDGSRTEVAQAIGWRKPGPGWPQRPSVITHGGISGARLWVDGGSGLVFAWLTNLWHAPEEPAIAVLESIYRARG